MAHTNPNTGQPCTGRLKWCWKQREKICESCQAHNPTAIAPPKLPKPSVSITLGTWKRLRAYADHHGVSIARTVELALAAGGIIDKE